MCCLQEAYFFVADSTSCTDICMEMSLSWGVTVEDLFCNPSDSNSLLCPSPKLANCIRAPTAHPAPFTLWTNTRPCATQFHSRTLRIWLCATPFELLLSSSSRKALEPITSHIPCTYKFASCATLNSVEPWPPSGALWFAPLPHYLSCCDNPRSLGLRLAKTRSSPKHHKNLDLRLSPPSPPSLYKAMDSDSEDYIKMRPGSIALSQKTCGNSWNINPWPSSIIQLNHAVFFLSHSDLPVALLYTVFSSKAIWNT